MIGEQYWATGILCIYDEYECKWAAVVKFFDDGFCQDESTEGQLRTRYYVDDLAAAIDTIVADAERLGIAFSAVAGCPRLYVKGDGEWDDVPLPDDWREVIAEQAKRLGWRDCYAKQAA